MAASKNLTPEQRTLRARLAAHASWANTEDRAERTAAACKASEDRFIRQAREKYGDLPEAELAQRAEHLRKAHFARMAFASAKARARKGGTSDA